MVSTTEMFFSENGLALFLNKGVVMGGIAGFPGSVCEVFCDFMEHLEDLRIAYSVEETDERIREQMKRE